MRQNNKLYLLLKNNHDLKIINRKYIKVLNSVKHRTC